MTEPNDAGYRVTLKDVDTKVDTFARETRDDLQKILDRLPEDAHARIRRLEAQMAAQWVVVGIVIVGLGSLLARSLVGIA